MRLDIHPDRLRINNCGRTNCAPNWSWRTDRFSWDDIDLWVVCAGQGEMKSPQGSTPLQRGSTWLLRGGESYAGLQDPNDRLMVSHTHFDLIDDQGAQIHWSSVEMPPRDRSIAHIAELDFILQSMTNVNRSAHNCLQARIFLATALQIIIEHDENVRNEQLSDLEIGIDQCCNDLLSNPHKWNSVQEMADACHTSVDYFSKQFQARIGKKPSHYLTTVKMDHARNLLRYTTLSAQQIADSIGYSDPGYFSRVFKKHHGQTPGTWRKQGN